jgi:hypothetical protein
MLPEALVGVDHGQTSAGGAGLLGLALGLEALDLVHNARHVAKEGLDPDLARVAQGGVRDDGAGFSHDSPPIVPCSINGELRVRNKAREGQKRAKRKNRAKAGFMAIGARLPCHTGRACSDVPIGLLGIGCRP